MLGRKTHPQAARQFANLALQWGRPMLGRKTTNIKRELCGCHASMGPSNVRTENEIEDLENQIDCLASMGPSNVRTENGIRETRPGNSGPGFNGAVQC